MHSHVVVTTNRTPTSRVAVSLESGRVSTSTGRCEIHHCTTKFTSTSTEMTVIFQFSLNFLGSTTVLRVQFSLLVAVVVLAKHLIS